MIVQRYLIAAKKEQYQSAVDSFERALDFAKLQEDDDAETAIKKALKEVNDKLANNAAEDPGMLLSLNNILLMGYQMHLAVCFYCP